MESMDAPDRIRACLNQISYIKAETPYVILACTPGDKPACALCKPQPALPAQYRVTLQELESRFSRRELLRVHRSYMVNSRKVVGIQKLGSREFEVLVKLGKGRVSLPVGKAYHQQIKELIPQWFSS